MHISSFLLPLTTLLTATVSAMPLQSRDTSPAATGRPLVINFPFKDINEMVNNVFTHVSDLNQKAVFNMLRTLKGAMPTESQGFHTVLACNSTSQHYAEIATFLGQPGTVKVTDLVWNSNLMFLRVRPTEDLIHGEGPDMFIAFGNVGGYENADQAVTDWLPVFENGKSYGGISVPVPGWPSVTGTIACQE